MPDPKTLQSPETIDPYAPTVMWWSWETACIRARRAGLDLSMNRLKVLGGAGAFECGYRDGAPSLKTPVRRVSFEKWLTGGSDWAKGQAKKQRLGRRRSGKAAGKG